jgi:hypothetical protein
LFALELASGGLVLDSWNWQTLSPGAWARNLWAGFLVNICVAVGEETLLSWENERKPLWNSSSKI